MKKYFLFNNETKIELDFDVEKLFLKLTNETFNLLNLKPQLFSVSLVSKYLIKKINNHYRGLNKVTDVISFSFLENQSNQFILGDIYICLLQAIKQAQKYKHSLKRELAFLFVHGLLHLLCFDHQNKEDEKIMFSYQDKILKKCKINR